MIHNKLTAIVLLWLFCGVSPSLAGTVTHQYDDLNQLVYSRHSNGVATAYGYDEIGNRTNKTVEYTCPDCSGDEILLKNLIFHSGLNCECNATISIDAQGEVVIQDGSKVRFTAPRIRAFPGVHIEKGAVFQANQSTSN